LALCLVNATLRFAARIVRCEPRGLIPTLKKLCYEDPAATESEAFIVTLFLHLALNQNT